MARIIGAIATSHVPAIGNAISAQRQNDPYWKPFFDGYRDGRAWLEAAAPDVVVMVYNDHGLNFFLDNLPTFAVGAAAEYRSEDEGWGLPTFPPYHGAPLVSWHIIESLVEQEFDIATCQEMVVDHAFINPLRLLWPDSNPPPIPFVPVCVNTVQHPLPKPSRCLKFGQALGRAIESYPEDLGVVIIGSGGMSHQLDGTRAGFINKRFDATCLEQLVDAPEALARHSIRDLVSLAGTQGVEIIMWLIMRAALHGQVAQVTSHYHVPISNTAAGVLVLENTPSVENVVDFGRG
jgi:protocatechuate 4,5-dioxygenase beta chain